MGWGLFVTGPMEDYGSATNSKHFCGPIPHLTGWSADIPDIPHPPKYDYEGWFIGVGILASSSPGRSSPARATSLARPHRVDADRHHVCADAFAITQRAFGTTSHRHTLTSRSRICSDVPNPPAASSGRCSLNHHPAGGDCRRRLTCFAVQSPSSRSCPAFRFGPQHDAVTNAWPQFMEAGTRRSNLHWGPRRGGSAHPPPRHPDLPPRHQGVRSVIRSHSPQDTFSNRPAR